MKDEKRTTKGLKEKKFDKDFNPKQKRERIGSCPTGYHSANDFKWYYQNPQVAKDAASIQFANVLGLPLSIGFLNATGTGNDIDRRLSFPGVMNISYVPIAGISSEGVADMNVAARLIYSYVRHANSGSRNYEASDIMTYLLAMGNAYVYYSELVKVYGLINTTSVLNRYVSKAIITSAGYNYDELVNNMADFRAFINWFAVKLNTFAVPKDMYLYDRWTFLPLNVYTDGVGSKIQFYNFCPNIMYTWSGIEAGGSALIPSYYRHATLEQIKEYGRNIINALLDNEDIGIMSGDILKAFRESGLRVVNGIESQYVTTFTRDEGILSQVHNMTVAPGEVNLDSLKIFQDNNVLICQPYVDASSAYSSKYIPKSIILDTWLEDPTPEAVMEMTRLAAIWDELNHVSDQVNLIKCTSCGSELVLNMEIAYYDANGSLTSAEIHTYYDAINGDTTINFEYVSLLSKFDWAPYIYLATDDDNGIPPYGDTQNYTLIDKTRLGVIHDVALQSLLNVYGLYIKAF